ncbi:UDP-N-acetylmuramoyl-L-alanyl-D-glutamate--2,6-diaminopimelate ligase [Basilea psittacipulmonis]|uniref:Multifunctional fusion protein n=1 Tax=Basilea psittacipulmonis DSM 24701 TaxID=1072685 RepID=A0A077DDV7_9BURK|nr:UDP-N-acetylmuramoyl-L-alanyl-D-glutamate--2,6-diaminopimelate ligase [Basilea psittacipulmonis]AIL32316.1 hypothetical protein IX83_02385 [Basilea psittacipulmonis DSM 24701]
MTYVNMDKTVVTEVLKWLKAYAQPFCRLQMDSRKVQAGDVFVAVKGEKDNGAKYLSQAIEKGAIGAIVDDPTMAVPIGFPVMMVLDLKKHLGEIAHHWYGKPSDQLKVIAITGTNGKTSTVNWIAQILNRAGMPCASLGTLGAILPDGQNLEASLTTPDVLSIHYLLYLCVQHSIQVVALEASSIGLDQGRLNSVTIDYAGFTNLTLDHLDYHQTLEHYAQSKALLFSRPTLKRMVINADDHLGQELIAEYPAAMSYSIKQQKATIQALDIDVKQGSYRLYYEGRFYAIQNQCLGLHNVANQLLVLGILTSFLPIEKIVACLNDLQPIDGRLQLVSIGNDDDPLVFVDYAHTPDALERALNSLRPLCQGKLRVVFGCGGDRDTSKRPIMGKIASDLADLVFITSDNPRTEEPDKIIQEIQSDLSDVQVEIKREVAILQAILTAEKNDVILIAGKGHETYQDSQGVKKFFDDRLWSALGLYMRHTQGFSTDSRHAKTDEIFIALKGERFDAHDFLANTASSVCVVNHLTPSVKDKKFIYVEDTYDALASMATAWRKQFQVPVIAVTGSNGKTTCKEMIASILHQAYGDDYLATKGNLNNHIGVPLTLLSMRAYHRAAVVEVGMNHPGEISYLAKIVQPTIALLNNAQREHQEFMKTVDAVARENACVFQYLTYPKIAVFPAHDVYTSLWCELAKDSQIHVFGEGTDYFVSDIQLTENRCVLNVKGQSFPITLNIAGQHNIHNALASATCADAAGIEPRLIAQGLTAFLPVKGRLLAKEIRGMTVIDDTYNANPDSVKAAIDVLSLLPHPQVLVLGDMAEVGENVIDCHQEVGQYAKQKGIDYLLSKGHYTRYASQEVETGQHFDDLKTLVDTIVSLKPKTVLVKGSRSAKMEAVIELLEEE